MRPARSRRVQAQRKFAQGAYVPPNVVPVAATDNRRDAAQDPRNVTINNITATGLLDVVSLQSTASSSDRNGHSHFFTSQPVVIVERLRGRIPPRDVPPPLQSEIVVPRHWEYPHERVNNNVATIKKPAEPPKLQTVKKKREYKREHPMLLRCRRPSKLELNKLIAESCAPRRRMAAKRKKNSSDEDEPLIFQKTRLKQAAKQASTSNQTAVRESAPKESTPKPNPPKEKPLKQKPCKKTKTVTTTNEIRQNDKQSIGWKKTQKTLMKRAPKTRIHKKCSPKQTAHVAPVQSVLEIPGFLITVIKADDSTDETDVQADNLVTQDDSVIGVQNDSPGFLITDVKTVSTDETVVQADNLVTQDDSVIGVQNDSPGFLITAIRTVSTDETVVQADNLVTQDDSVIGVQNDSPGFLITAIKTVSTDETVVQADNLVTQDDSVIGVQNDSPGFLITVIKTDSTDETVVQADNLVTQDDSVIGVPNDPVTPEVLDDLVAQGVPVATDDPVVPPVPVIQSVSNVPMVLDDETELSRRIQVPADLDEVLAGLDEVFLDERIAISEYNVSTVNDSASEDDVPLIKSAMTIGSDIMVQVDTTDLPITNLRIASPEDDAIYSDHRMDLGSDEPFPEEMLQNTAPNLERARNVQFEVPSTCVAAKWRSDQDVINASQELLDSRCKVCKPCIRIEKLMKVSTLLKSQIELTSKGQENNAAVLDNEPTEREGEEDVVIEIDNEDADATSDDQDHLYLLLPKHSCVMLKLRTSMVHGKEVLGVRLMPRDESLKNNQEFSLEEQEHLLDQLIETLTIDPDVDSEGRNENIQLPNVNTEGQNNKTEGQNDNTQGRSDKLKGQNDILESRRISISSDSTAEMSDATTHDTSIRLTAKRKLKRLAVKKKLAEAELMQDRIRAEKEREIARLEEEKRQEISRITAEKNIAVAQMSRCHERFTQMEKEKERHFARLRVEIRADVISKIEANRRMCAEVDGMAANLAKEKDAKKMDPEELADPDAPGTSTSLLTTDGGLLVDAPIYHPTEEDFSDPLHYYEKIWPEAVRYGICKVVPPPGWNPPFRVHDEMRFDVTNQYISRLFNRWGPAARELCAIKLSLAQQKVNFTRAPLLDGVEVNLPKLYHLVQRHGGLETVYNKKRWGKVAEDMKFNKGPNTERKLDQIYVKYLLPYDTLSHQERQDIMRKVEIAWNRKNQKLLDRAVNPLNRQKRLLGLMDSSDDETEDEDTVAAVNEAEDCIIKGAVMNRAKFKKIATMTYENTFGQGSEVVEPPDLSKIEEYYWRLVTLGTEHVCVHTAAIDTGEEGYGFIKNKSDSYGRHPWNPKMVSHNPRNVLQYLGPVLGVTVPTLLLGMLFSTSCWHKDPHAVSWLEYQLLGPERIWYGIPAHQADNFRKAVETLCPTSCQNKGLWLPTDITMIPPNLLREHNVTLSRVSQRDGEYILAFPNAYTCCISTGYTESESVYFAPPSWLENLWTVFKEARESCEPTMFAMEHLLYNIGKDPKAEHTILKIAQPLYDKMLREEVTNRQMLQERGLPFSQDLLGTNTSRKKNKANPFNPRGQDECEYCRATLYLSKVEGLTGRNTVLCLEHALKLLDTERHKDKDVKQLQVLVHVSVKELNTVHDDMKRRLGMPIA